jgi:transcriptional regulator GlxA family with amidase domain
MALRWTVQANSPKTACPFVLYVNRLRINRACQLLVSGEPSVTGIRYQVGNNLSNFNPQFLLLKELAPSRWRAYQQFNAAGATESHDAAPALEAFS